MGEEAQPGAEKLVLDKGALVKWLIGAAVVAAVVVGFSVYNSPSNRAERDAKARMEVSPELAERECERQVESRLKAPSTSKFNDITAQGDGNYRFKVTGTVDAENSFGAMIRNDFVCDITITETETTTHSVTVD